MLSIVPDSSDIQFHFQTALGGQGYDHNCTEKEIENRTPGSRFFPFPLCFFHAPEYFQYLYPRKKDNMEKKLFKNYQEWGLIPISGLSQPGDVQKVNYSFCALKLSDEKCNYIKIDLDADPGSQTHNLR